MASVRVDSKHENKHTTSNYVLIFDIQCKKAIKLIKPQKGDIIFVPKHENELP
jgi:hypothetical protein